MKRGFLQPAYGAVAANSRSGVSASPADTPPRQPSALPTPSDTSNIQSLVPVCLQLLQGATDEKKMAGIMLATKLLPTADDTFLRQVLQTLGDTFLDRLLVPLRVYRPLVTSSQPLPAVYDALRAKLERQAASAALGVALLASVVHLRDVVSQPAYIARWGALAAVWAWCVLTTDCTSTHNRSQSRALCWPSPLPTPTWSCQTRRATGSRSPTPLPA